MKGGSCRNMWFSARGWRPGISGHRPIVAHRSGRRSWRRSGAMPGDRACLTCRWLEGRKRRRGARCGASPGQIAEGEIATAGGAVLSCEA